MGFDFLDDYVKRLSKKDRKELAKTKSKATFSFGDGKTVKSATKVRCPIYLGSQRHVLEVDVVDVKIPMLISLEAMQSMEMQLHLSKVKENRAYINGEFIKLMDRSGHIWISVTEETSRSHVDEEVSEDDVLIASKSIFQGKNVRNELKKLHDNLGHIAKDRLCDIIKEGGYWDQTMKEEVEHLYSNCPSRRCRREGRWERDLSPASRLLGSWAK